MEPCLFRHGKGADVDRHEVRAVASMEPCLFRHGKAMPEDEGGGGALSFNGAMSFQTW